MSDSFVNEFIKSEVWENAGLPEEIVNHYNMLERLAVNELGETYLLSEKNSKRYVLKCYAKNQISEKFNEADILSGLHHSGLPKFENKIENKDSLFVLREYADGQPLDRYIEENGVFEKARAVQIITELCDILSYLHTQSPPIIHRDIKPSNIIYKPDNQKITLIDFGISRKYSAESETDTTTLGTKKFAPPEQYGFSQTDCRADIYALGILFRFLLTGHADGASEDRRLEQIINKCTAFSPKDRYKSAEAVKSALRKYTTSTLKKTLRIAAAVFIFIAAVIFFVKPPSEVPETQPINHTAMDETPEEETLGETPAAREIYVFSDPFMEATVRAALGKDETEPVYLHNLYAIEVLFFAQDAVVTTQEGYSELTQMLSYFDETELGFLQDISDVRHMLNLQQLYIAAQPVSDLSPLSDCYFLGKVSIMHCPNVTDISPLADCREIYEVDLIVTGISDLSPLARLPLLNHLRIKGDLIRDLSPIGEMNALRHLLFLPPHSAYSLEFFGNNGDLDNLVIRGNEFISLDGIERLPNLRVLDISYTGVTDFSPLNTHPTIEELHISRDMTHALPTFEREDIILNIENG